jgi:integrase/recombinase XerD
MAKTKDKKPAITRPLSELEICKVDQAISENRNELRNRALFYLCLHSGLRISEVCALKIKDIMPSERFRGRVKVKTFGKENARVRMLVIPEVAHEALKNYLKQRIKTNSGKPGDPLFFAPRSPTESITPNVAWSIIRKSIRKSGIRNISTNSLKSTFVKALVKQGTDILEIQKVAGYKSPTSVGSSVEKAFLRRTRKPKTEDPPATK